MQYFPNSQPADQTPSMFFKGVIGQNEQKGFFADLPHSFGTKVEDSAVPQFLPTTFGPTSNHLFAPVNVPGSRHSEEKGTGIRTSGGPGIEINKGSEGRITYSSKPMPIVPNLQSDSGLYEEKQRSATAKATSPSNRGRSPSSRGRSPSNRGRSPGRVKFNPDAIRQLAPQIFGAFDVHRNGLITKEEACAALNNFLCSARLPPIDIPTAAQLLHLADLDRNQMISFNEFCFLLQNFDGLLQRIPRY